MFQSSFDIHRQSCGLVFIYELNEFIFLVFKLKKISNHWFKINLQKEASLLGFPGALIDFPGALMSFSGGSVVKNLPAMQETQVQSLGQEDPLEKEMATCCSILAWRIPQTEEPGMLQSMGSQRVRYD